MKKLLVVLGTAALLLSSIPAANALHHGVSCVTRHNGGSYHDVCEMVNTNDVYSGDKIEALSDHWVNPGNHDPAEIQYDYVKLWRQKPNGDYVVAMSVGPRDWTRTNNDSYSTTWYSVCQSPDSGTFHTEARYRLKWTAEPGDPIGQWFVQNSNESSEPCG